MHLIYIAELLNCRSVCQLLLNLTTVGSKALLFVTDRLGLVDVVEDKATVGMSVANQGRIKTPKHASPFGFSTAKVTVFQAEATAFLNLCNSKVIDPRIPKL